MGFEPCEFFIDINFSGEEHDLLTDAFVVGVDERLFEPQVEFFLERGDGCRHSGRNRGDTLFDGAGAFEYGFFQFCAFARARGHKLIQRGGGGFAAGIAQRLGGQRVGAEHARPAQHVCRAQAAGLRKHLEHLRIERGELLQHRLV